MDSIVAIPDQSLTFLRISAKEDSPFDGFIYEYKYGNASKEIHFKTHEEAALVKSHILTRRSALPEAQKLFEKWKDIDEVYVTSDGKLFAWSTEARDNILKLEDKWFSEIYREEI